MGQETPPVMQDFLTDAEIERLREIQELAERGKDEETIRAEAWSDLSDLGGYGVSDLEAFIDAASERRTRLSERYSEIYSEKMPTTANFVSAVSEQEMKRQWAKKRASEEMYQFRKQTIPLTQKLRRLRVRKEVAEEILDRRLYGYEVPSSPPDEADRLVTPLSEYEPTGAPKEILETLVNLNEDRDLTEARSRAAIWRLVYRRKEEASDLPDNAANQISEALRRSMKRSEVYHKWPETTEEVKELAQHFSQRWDNVGPSFEP
jgi:hypothetical protein